MLHIYKIINNYNIYKLHINSDRLSISCSCFKVIYELHYKRFLAERNVK